MRAAALALLLLAGPALAGALPDARLTPGVTVPMTLHRLCTTRWGKDARVVTAAMKREVMRRYQMTPADCPSGKVEIDHLVGRELGGADALENLWGQCYEAPVAGLKPSETPEWGAHKKDRLENRLHVEVCAGNLPLEEAQAMLRTNWIDAYRHFFHEP